MNAWRALSTGAVVVAIGGCAATVVAFAATQPKGKPEKPAALPTSSTVDVLPATVAVPTAPSPTARPTHSAPPTPSAPHPRRPATSRPPTPSTRPATHRPTPKAPPPPKPASPRGQSVPLGYTTGLASRVITVVASSTGSTTARLQAWTKAPGGGWLHHGPAVTAHVGSQGLTAHPSEDKSATPIGSFTLTQAFGRLGNPGTSLPYFTTDSADWWVSDRNSRYYNTHYRCSNSCPFNTGAGENLRAAGSVYNYAVVIDYNRSPVRPGAGSAFFLHVTDGSATAGCVAIPQDRLVALMKWLGPGTHPRILIGVA